MKHLKLSRVLFRLVRVGRDVADESEVEVWHAVLCSPNII